MKLHKKAKSVDVTVALPKTSKITFAEFWNLLTELYSNPQKAERYVKRMSKRIFEQIREDLDSFMEKTVIKSAEHVTHESIISLIETDKRTAKFFVKNMEYAVMKKQAEQKRDPINLLIKSSALSRVQCERAFSQAKGKYELAQQILLWPGEVRESSPRSVKYESDHSVEEKESVKDDVAGLPKKPSIVGLPPSWRQVEETAGRANNDGTATGEKNCQEGGVCKHWRAQD